MQRARQHLQVDVLPWRAAFFALVVDGLAFRGHFRSSPVLDQSVPPLHGKAGGGAGDRSPELPFNLTPVAISVIVAVGGLLLGWLVYRKYAAAGAVRQVPCKKFRLCSVPIPAKALGRVWTLLQQKYYFDELYDKVFVKAPCGWRGGSSTSMIGGSLTRLWNGWAAFGGMSRRPAVGRCAHCGCRGRRCGERDAVVRQRRQEDPDWQGAELPPGCAGDSIGSTGRVLVVCRNSDCRFAHSQISVGGILHDELTAYGYCLRALIGQSWSCCLGKMAGLGLRGFRRRGKDREERLISMAPSSSA